MMSRALPWQAIAAALLLCGFAAPLSAAAIEAGTPTDGLEGPDELAGLQTVSDADLSEQRGGFEWNGLNISLGADIRTYLNGQLALQTLVSWTAAGSSVSQIVSGALTPATAAQIQAGVFANGQITMHVGDSTVFLANQGETAIFHRTDGGLQNVLINTASGVNISQQVDATLNLSGYEQFNADLIGSRLGYGLGDAAGAASAGALGY